MPQWNRIYAHGKILIEGFIHPSGVEVKFVGGREVFVLLSCSGIGTGQATTLLGLKRLLRKFIRYAIQFNQGKDPKKLIQFFELSRDIRHDEIPRNYIVHPVDRRCVSMPDKT